jgi:hypothetical protein
MKTRAITITTILLILSLGNYFRVISHNGIRAVEFISIFVIGTLAGVLITLIFMKLKDKK